MKWQPDLFAYDARSGSGESTGTWLWFSYRHQAPDMITLFLNLNGIAYDWVKDLEYSPQMQEWVVYFMYPAETEESPRLDFIDPEAYDKTAQYDTVHTEWHNPPPPSLWMEYGLDDYATGEASVSSKIDIVGSGIHTVTTTAEAMLPASFPIVGLSATEITSILLVSDSGGPANTNADLIFVGTATNIATTGFGIRPGQFLMVEDQHRDGIDLSSIYIRAGSGTQGLMWTAFGKPPETA